MGVIRRLSALVRFFTGYFTHALGGDLALYLLAAGQRYMTRSHERCVTVANCRVWPYSGKNH